MKFAWGNDAPDYYLSKKLLYGMLAGSERYADSTDRIPDAGIYVKIKYV